MTLAQLQTYDVPGAWTRLTPEQQAAIGEATIAWQIASLAAEHAASADEAAEANDMALDAEGGVADAVEAALPEIDWQPIPGAPSSPPTL